jgi:hypothetical protein
MKDQIQEVDILVAPVLFDGVEALPIPCLKLASAISPLKRAASCRRRFGNDPSKAIPPTRVSAAELRDGFAKGEYLTRAARGEFGCCLTASNPSRSVDEPIRTPTVVVSYLDESLNRAFMVHFSLKPD